MTQNQAATFFDAVRVNAPVVWQDKKFHVVAITERHDAATCEVVKKIVTMVPAGEAEKKVVLRHAGGKFEVVDNEEIVLVFRCNPDVAYGLR